MLTVKFYKVDVFSDKKQSSHHGHWKVHSSKYSHIDVTYYVKPTAEAAARGGAYYSYMGQGKHQLTGGVLLSSMFCHQIMSKLYVMFK